MHIYKKFFIVIFAIAIFVLLSFLFLVANTPREKIEVDVKEKVKPVTLIDFYVNEHFLEQEVNLIYLDDLRPNIKISASFDLRPKEKVSLFIDNSSNVIKDSFYGDTSYDDAGLSIEFVPSFALTPGLHTLEFVLFDNEEKHNIKRNFFVGYYDSFDKNLSNSKVWIIPEKNPDNWFLVKNGNLSIIPQTKDGHSSLAFLYQIENNVKVDFSLKPLGENVSLLFYFINSVKNQFVFGSNDNQSTVLLRNDKGGSSTLYGKEFKFETESSYQIRIVRKNGEYTLSARKNSDENKINPFLEEDCFEKLLVYIDPYFEKTSSHPTNIGFALWNNSNGVFLDDVYILTGDIPTFLKP